MTIFKLSKETVVKIEYQTGVNQETVYCLGYQENINDLLDGSLKELNNEDQEDYLAMYRTNTEDVIYDVQLRSAKPNTTFKGNKTITDA
eukprot:10667153-Ditylum_brightwellii.AAC.1